MPDAQLVLIHIADLDPTATHFNLRFSTDGTTWTDYSTSSATPSSPEDLSVALLDASDNYLLDGVNSPAGNMAAASYAGNWYEGRLKGADGYGNWSTRFNVAPLAVAAPGWPVAADVLQKLQYTNPEGLTASVTNDVDNLLAAIIAEFQSPPNGAAGGTGRNFEPVTETRLFDGNGYPELRVPDIVPGTAFTVHAYDAYLTDVQLAAPVQPWLGWNRLIRPQGAGSIVGASYATPGIFPIGLQNISVAATWGFAATVPPDVWEAVRCEAAHRALVQGAVPLAGIGSTITMGPFSINTSAGVSVWGQSSPIAVFHQTYVNCVSRYRDRAAWRRAQVVRRMS